MIVYSTYIIYIDDDTRKEILGNDVTYKKTVKLVHFITIYYYILLYKVELTTHNIW